MLDIINIIHICDPANIATYMTIEMLQHLVNVVPNNGYAITNLNVLLGMVLINSGTLCIAKVNGGYINGIIVNSFFHTVDPNLINPFCNTFLG